jgi:beta-1,4-mannosyltransferase
VRPIVVQQSFPDPRPTSNPYIALLAGALGELEGVEVRTFSWRRALLQRADVFHAHWPEILVSGRGPLRTAVRQLLFVLLLLRLRVAGTAVVRTVHNLELPSGLSRIQRLLLQRMDRMVDLRIALNDDTPFAEGESHAVIPHGHYRDWFARYNEPAPVVGRYGYFGLVRRYKNVGGLVEAFRGLPGDTTLEVAGKPSSPDLVTEIEAQAQGDPRVHLRFEYLSDADLVGVAGRAEMVVLPYSHMHNSGGVLAALSLGRPVLVPATPTNDRLAAEVGPGWVFRYDGALGTDDLERALEERRSVDPAGRPDLSARDWSASAALHEKAYRRAVALRTGR